jgi:hypothetical protein
MALSKAVIQGEISKIIDQTDKLDRAKAQEQFASKLADAIINAIKSATVTVQPGIPVSTSGGAGLTTGPGAGTIS